MGRGVGCRRVEDGREDEPGGKGSLWNFIYRGVMERFKFHGVLERMLEGGGTEDELARER